MLLEKMVAGLDVEASGSWDRKCVCKVESKEAYFKVKTPLCQASLDLRVRNDSHLLYLFKLISCIVKDTEKEASCYPRQPDLVNRQPPRPIQFKKQNAPRDKESAVQDPLYMS